MAAAGVGLFLCGWLGPSGYFSDSKFYLTLVCGNYFVPGKSNITF